MQINQEIPIANVGIYTEWVTLEGENKKTKVPISTILFLDELRREDKATFPEYGFTLET